jgi:hypothetical protein
VVSANEGSFDYERASLREALSPLRMTALGKMTALEELIADN